MRNALLILPLLTLFTLTACKKQVTTTRTLSAPTTGSCVIGRWPAAYLPLSLKMSSEFTGDYAAGDLVGGLNPLERMAEAWNAPLTTYSKTLITTPFGAAATTGYTSTSSFRDSEIGIYKSHTWFSGVTSSALAITQFFGVVSTDPGLGQYIDLTHADIIVNYRDYGTRLTMTGTPAAEFDLPTIVLHEMGHLLGLCHESSKPSIMAPYYLSTQHDVQAYDKTLIKNLYVDGVISALSTNANAIAAPVGSEVTGIIELHPDGTCNHYVNGKKIYQHSVDLKKK